MKYIKLTSLVAVLLFTQLFGGKSQLKLEKFTSGDIAVAGFKLLQQTNIEIDALGAGESSRHRGRSYNFRDKNGMLAYAWIVNSDTREVVWNMSTDNTHRKGDKYFRRFKGDVTLPAGNYEVYFSTLRNPWSIKYGIYSFGDLLEYIINGNDWWENGLDRWYIEIDNIDEILTDKDVETIRAKFYKDAVISMSEVGDAAYEEYNFEISKEMTFDIYALGEGFEGEMYDYAWITNLKTRDKVWEMNIDDCDYAGGAAKNVMIRTFLTLPAGSYSITYVTDGSHSFEKWNANPPYDPTSWGVSLFLKNKNDKSFFKKYKSRKEEPVISIYRVGNDELICRPFEVLNTTIVRIEAMGEGRSGKMFDYGWIEDAEENIVWEMKYLKTRHAGGSAKNRMLIEDAKLKKGKYRLCYLSDDSHSFQRWNEAKPYNCEKWGIAIFPTDKQLIKPVKELKLQSGGKWDYRLVKLPDNTHRTVRFELNKLSKINIYALGEGDSDEMFDYGWIEDLKTGEIVWRMLYENTEWAGGARKNRKLKTTVYLPPGAYQLHYLTDDSHSYKDWNDDRPTDWRNYGISIKVEPVQ